MRYELPYGNVGSCLGETDLGPQTFLGSDHSPSTVQDNRLVGLQLAAGSRILTLFV